MKTLIEFAYAGSALARIVPSVGMWFGLEEESRSLTRNQLHIYGAAHVNDWYFDDCSGTICEWPLRREANSLQDRPHAASPMEEKEDRSLRW